MQVVAAAQGLHFQGAMYDVADAPYGVLYKESRLSSSVLKVCCLPLGIVSWSRVVAFWALYRSSWHGLSSI
jgi:hypothetical protein